MIGRAKPRAARSCVVGLASLALMMSCERDEAPQSSGDPSAAFGLDVLTVRDCPAPKHAKPSVDEHLVGVEVEVRANLPGVPANYYYGRLTDDQGNTYRPTLYGCSPTLTSPPLKSGQTKRGFVNFKLPSRAAGLTFEYAPVPLGGGAQPASSVALPLGR